MFIDWLTVHQDFDFQLPLIGERAFIAVDTVTGDQLSIKCPSIRHQGSYSTSIQILISGNRVTISGNPSRFNRIDNLFGFSTIDQCILVYNQILKSYGLPSLTKCTRVWHLQQKTNKVATVSDGAVITEIHLTTNRAVGQKNQECYIRSLSTQPYKNSKPRIHSNGQTIDWLSKKGNARLIYPSVYNKGFELELHSFTKLKRKYGALSPEVKYLFNVINYCNFHGVVRFEQKIKSEFLRRNNMCFYGLFEEKLFRPIHEEFLAIDQRLQVDNMNIETITQQLIRTGICETTRAANVTTLYAIQWMHGHIFDLQKSQVKTHRARLRQIGIDIAMPCDITKFSLVNIRSSETITVLPLDVPSWYQRPSVNHLSLAA